MQLALGGRIGSVTGGKYRGCVVVPKNEEVRFCGFFNKVKFSFKREEVESYQIFKQSGQYTELSLSLKDSSHFTLQVFTSYLYKIMDIIGK